MQDTVIKNVRVVRPARRRTDTRVDVHVESRQRIHGNIVAVNAGRCSSRPARRPG